MVISCDADGSGSGGDSDCDDGCDADDDDRGGDLVEAMLRAGMLLVLFCIVELCCIVVIVLLTFNHSYDPSGHFYASPVRRS